MTRGWGADLDDLAKSFEGYPHDIDKMELMKILEDFSRRWFRHDTRAIGTNT